MRICCFSRISRGWLILYDLEEEESEVAEFVRAFECPFRNQHQFPIAGNPLVLKIFRRLHHGLDIFMRSEVGDHITGGQDVSAVFSAGATARDGLLVHLLR